MDELILTAKEASRLLKINIESLYELLEQGEIPAFREGCRWKIPSRLLQGYAESRAIEEARERKRVYQEGDANNERV